jgi:hypothetical protein
MFTTLDLGDMVAIACASPPNTAVYDAMTGGWSREAHLIANMQEGSAGLVELNHRYDRPGMYEQQEQKFVPMDDMSWDEMDAALEANYALGPSSEMAGVK